MVYNLRIQTNYWCVNISVDTPSIRKVIMARFNITLPDALEEKLELEASSSKTKKSTLIAKFIKERYEGTSLAEYEEQLQKCKDENAILWHKIGQFKEDTAENAAAHAIVVKELQAEFETAKILTKNLEEGAAEKDTKIQQLEQDLTAALGTVEALEQSSQDLIGKLKAEGENYERSLAEQECRHKDTLNEEEHRHTNVANALRHEQELTAAKLESVQLQLQQERDHNLELRTDKEKLQNQLELVTLRLPAPKEGF